MFSNGPEISQVEMPPYLANRQQQHTKTSPIKDFRDSELVRRGTGRGDMMAGRFSEANLRFSALNCLFI